MKIPVVTLATAMLLSATAQAGVRIETVTRNIKTQAVEGPAQTVLVQGGVARITSPDGGMLLKGSSVYVIDDKHKTYREIDKATLQQASAAMAQVQAQLKNMPPEQRAQIEKMMGGGLGNDTQVVYDSKDTGKSESVEGRSCRVWNMLRNGVVYEEVCVVPFSSLPGKEDLQATFKRIAEAFEDLAASMPIAAKDVKARSNINGYPVRVRPIENGKPTGRETVLKSWIEEAIPASSLAIPAGYKKQEMPTISY